MKHWIYGKSICLGIGIVLAQLINGLPNEIVSAEEFIPGGNASMPAAAAYEEWMQFGVPDTQTPAIDEDGCLNYALAKLGVRYNLPIETETQVSAEMVTALTDSYTYYVAFTKSLSTRIGTKMDHMAEVYQTYLTRKDSVWLSGTIEERIDKTYTVCSQLQTQGTYAVVLQLTTATGSDHYVLVDRADTVEERLYLLDTGSRYIDYLGDAKSTEKGYQFVAIHPFQIHTIPGDANQNGSIESGDIEWLLTHSAEIDVLHGDANHDGIVNTADAVYLAKYLQYQFDAELTIQYALTPSVATETTVLSPVSKTTPGFYTQNNDVIFQNQLS